MQTEFVERRSGDIGRREIDKHKCIFHNDFEKSMDSNRTHILNCLIAIKERVKALERAMGGTMTLKIAAIITTVAMGFLIVFIGTAFNVIYDFKDDMNAIRAASVAMDKRVDVIQNNQTKMAVEQGHIMTTMSEVKKKMGQIK